MKKYIEIPFKEYTLRGFHHTVESDVCLVMLHGFTGNCNENGRFKGISEMVEEMNINSIRVDFLCHGESDLTFKDMRFNLLVAQGKTIIEYAHSLGYKEVYLLGYSMGGLTALHLLDQDVTKVILMSPAFNFKENIALRYDNAPKLPNGDVDYGARILNKEFVHSFTDVDELKFSKSYANEVLVVMGSDDEVIGVDSVVEGMNQFKDATIILISKCGHGYNSIQSRNELQTAIKSYLKR